MHVWSFSLHPRAATTIISSFHVLSSSKSDSLIQNQGPEEEDVEVNILSMHCGKLDLGRKACKACTTVRRHYTAGAPAIRSEWTPLLCLSCVKFWSCTEDSTEAEADQRARRGYPKGAEAIPAKSVLRTEEKPSTKHSLHQIGYHAGQNNYKFNSRNVRLCNVIGITNSAEIYVCNVCALRCFCHSYHVNFPMFFKGHLMFPLAFHAFWWCNRKMLAGL